jgi:hypothetical protein
MSTPYSRACYFARKAADLCRFNGLWTPGLSHVIGQASNVCWIFHHAETGLDIVLTAGGKVNASATKEHRIAKEAQEQARLVASAKEAEALAAAIDVELARLDAAQGPDDGRKSLDELESEDAAAKAEERAKRQTLDELDPCPRDSLAPLTARAMNAAGLLVQAPTAAPWVYPLAPVRPALESPLFPITQGAARVVMALARGIDPARLIKGDFGPAARSTWIA